MSCFSSSSTLWSNKLRVEISEVFDEIVMPNRAKIWSVCMIIHNIIVFAVGHYLQLRQERILSSNVSHILIKCISQAAQGHVDVWLLPHHRLYQERIFSANILTCPCKRHGDRPDILNIIDGLKKIIPQNPNTVTSTIWWPWCIFLHILLSQHTLFRKYF